MNVTKNIVRLASVVLLAGALFACNAPQKEKKEVKNMEKKETTATGVTRFEPLKGYFIKNDVVFESPRKFVVATNNETFDKYFGVGKTMENEVTPPDFDKYYVAGILLQPSDTKQEIELVRFTSEGAKQIVEFNVKAGDKQSFTSGGLLLFKIPKSRSVVDFISDGETVSVEVK